MFEDHLHEFWLFDKSGIVSWIFVPLVVNLAFNSPQAILSKLRTKEPAGLGGIKLEISQLEPEGSIAGKYRSLKSNKVTFIPLAHDGVVE